MLPNKSITKYSQIKVKGREKLLPVIETIGRIPNIEEISMKYKKVPRECAVWDPNYENGTGTEFKVLNTDWNIVTTPPNGVRSDHFMNAAFRILLETCKVDPDLFVPLTPNPVPNEAYEINKLINQAIENVSNLK